MKTKMIDIFPPSFKKESEENRYYTEEKRKKRWGKNLIIPFCIVLLLVLGYLYYSLYKTEVVVYPVTGSFEEEREVLARSAGSLGENEVRARVFRERIKGSRRFAVEERVLVEEKAEGEIEICQDYSDSSVPLVEGTRFVSDKGKLFLAKERFTLPARSHEAGSVVAGCAKIGVIAAEPGEDYNIPAASKFSLPGLQGTAIYGRVEGMSIEIKKEGKREEVPYLGEEEMQRNEKELSEELFAQGLEMIKEKHGESYLFEGDMQYGLPEIIDRSFEEKEEGEAVLQLEVRTKVIAISKEEIEEYARNLLPENHTWESKETNFSFSRANFEVGELEFIFGFSAKIYETIDKEQIKGKIAGLGFEEAERELEETVNAKQINFRTYPFGLGSVAGNPERIEVKFEFDKN